MPLNVMPSLRLNRPSLPAAGGAVRATFSASTDEGESLLRAEYRLDANIPYRLAGSPQLPPTGVIPDQRDYRSDPPLTLQPTGDTSEVDNVRITAVVHEVGPDGEDGERFESIGRVAIIQPTQPAAAATTAANLGARLKAFRGAEVMTQEEAAQRAGVARSTISRVENGSAPSAGTRVRIEGLLGS